MSPCLAQQDTGTQSQHGPKQNAATAMSQMATNGIHERNDTNSYSNREARATAVEG